MFFIDILSILAEFDSLKLSKIFTWLSLTLWFFIIFMMYSFMNSGESSVDMGDVLEIKSSLLFEGIYDLVT